MNYQTDTDKICNIISKAASRGYVAPPKPYSWDREGKTLHQCVAFTPEDIQAIHEYQAKYASVLVQIDYPISTMFGEPERRTFPLLSMLTSMLKEDTDCDYAMENVRRLRNALASHAEQFELNSLEIL